MAAKKTTPKTTVPAPAETAGTPAPAAKKAAKKAANKAATKSAAPKAAKAPAAKPAKSPAPKAAATAGRISLPVHPGAGVLAEVVRRIDAVGLEVAELSLHRPSLDDVFLTLTGHSADAASAVVPAPSRRRFGRRANTEEAAA